ncbi:TIGR00269 family protein [Candidatus Woesearchaeota archaeon]|nr:TIGR00269 family protein [Candidatus Woesearchaeota archaeon]
MVCQKCAQDPVYEIPKANIQYCKTCFSEYFEHKVWKTIREYGLIEKNDHIGVAVSGGKDSMTLLYLLANFAKERRDIKITAIAIDEGIEGYRNRTLDGLKKFCGKEKINLRIFSYQEEFGKPLDIMVKKYPKACSVCGVLRRYLLNTKAKQLGITKLATGHNLDDEAQSVLMNQFRNNPAVSSRLGPITGVVQDAKFVKRIKPLYFLSEKETSTYAFLRGFMDTYIECPYASDSYRAQVRDMLYEFEAKFPGTKKNIIQSFLEVLPVLKSKYKAEMRYCQTCGEPSQNEQCKACQFIQILTEK